MSTIDNKTRFNVPALAVIVIVLGWMFTSITNNQRAIAENQKSIAVITAEFKMYCESDKQ